MKKKLKDKSAIRLLTILVIAFIGITGCTTHDHASDVADTYLCPMHPTVISDRPGVCPVCGMDLVRKARPGEEVKITEDLSALLKSPNEVVVGTIKSIKGEYKSVPVTLSAQGIVTYDRRNVYTIPARMGGRLERLFIKHAYQRVSKGQKIAEIYSPDLVTAQRELLFLLEHDPANTTLIEAAKRKLGLLGISSSQISRLITSKEANTTIAVYSPYAGYVIPADELPTSPGNEGARQTTNIDMGGDMTPARSSSMPRAQTRYALIREGDYVTTGQALFTVVSGDGMLVELDLPDVHNGQVSKGDHVELRYGHNQYERAKVDLVQPFFTDGKNFLKVRIYTHRTDLRVGSLVKAEIKLDSTEALWVPKEAVLDLGMRKVAFLKERGVFKPKAVTTGASAAGMIEISSGLASTDEIAANAYFLVDSESFIKTRE